MLFRLRQPLPMLLALLRDLDSKALRPKMVLRGLRIIENFHFMYTAVASQPSSGGVSGMYARSARDCCTASTSQAKTKVLTDAGDQAGGSGCRPTRSSRPRSSSCAAHGSTRSRRRWCGTCCAGCTSPPARGASTPKSWISTR